MNSFFALNCIHITICDIVHKLYECQIELFLKMSLKLCNFLWITNNNVHFLEEVFEKAWQIKKFIMTWMIAAEQRIKWHGQSRCICFHNKLYFTSFFLLKVFKDDWLWFRNISMNTIKHFITSWIHFVVVNLLSDILSNNFNISFCSEIE